MEKEKKSQEINREEEPDTNNLKSKKYLSSFLKKVDEQQDNGPFNLRDSGIVEELHRKLDENAVNYDNEPVTACPHCHSLYLLDIDDTLECFNCGNVLEEKDVVVYKSIISYLDERNKGTTGEE